MEQLRTNHKIELAREYIQNTHANIFLTGKAGSGKTTFMREITRSINKRAVVAAPTGVAAINAGGVTLHSLFQLPFSPFIPGVPTAMRSGGASGGYTQRLSKSKISIIRSMELLIIDEVSMVRCDMLDAVDHTLRRVRRSSQPFGGVQLLLIGDIQQLAPICHEQEWELLREHYTTPYFFDSQALRSTPYIPIEFDEIFRQGDTHFTDILNAVRTNTITSALLEELNRRYVPNFEPPAEADYITLTTHNSRANAINTQKLAALTTTSRRYTASVKGDFAATAYPNDYELELKVGAQVLFVKNDMSPRRRYYNGMIGVVRAMSSTSVEVEPKEGGEVISVEVVAWESVEYRINPSNGEMEQSVKGSFSQLPLKCAWAITIHKSQGLSFDHAIIDASGSFAHGQVYVALSRCRTLEGMVLRTPISMGSIIGDSLIDEYSTFVSTDRRGEESLEAYKRDYYVTTLCAIFDFSKLRTALWDAMAIMRGAEAQAYPKLAASLAELLATFDKSILQVGRTFQIQLREMFASHDDYVDNIFIGDRLRRAADYFAPRIEPLRKVATTLGFVESDSADVRNRLRDLTKELKGDVTLLITTLEICAEGFSMERYQSERAKSIALESVDATTETKRKATKATPKADRVDASSDDIQHPELIKTLQAWRKSQAEEEGASALYMVLSNKTIMNLQSDLPSTISQLSEVKGVGKMKLQRYGDQLLEIINDYCANYDIRR